MEQVDVGEEALRTIISGLVKYVPVEEMQVYDAKNAFKLYTDGCQSNHCAIDVLHIT